MQQSTSGLCQWWPGAASASGCSSSTRCRPNAKWTIAPPSTLGPGRRPQAAETRLHQLPLSHPESYPAASWHSPSWLMPEVPAGWTELTEWHSASGENAPQHFPPTQAASLLDKIARRWGGPRSLSPPGLHTATAHHEQGTCAPWG